MRSGLPAALSSGLLHLCVFLFPSITFAEPAVYRLGVNEGMPSNHVYHMLVDRHGYLWVATAHSVIRYDGYAAKVFDLSAGLPSNEVWGLHEDRQGRIWVLCFCHAIGYIVHDDFHLVALTDPEHNYSFEIREDLLPVNPPATQSRGDMKGVFIDFDNDGLKDLVMAQGVYNPATDRTYFWRQQADHSFVDATASMGMLLADLKSTSFAEAIDFDMDGDDDLLTTNPNLTAVSLWENTVGQDKNYVAVKLQALSPGINKNAIGARIYVYCDGKMQMREVMAGRGMHTGQQPFILNFGLGDATVIDSIVVRWPDANCTRSAVYNPPVNKIVTINSFPTGVDMLERFTPEIKVFPNPTLQYVVIQQPGIVDRTSNIAVLDITGKILNIDHSTSDGDKLIFDLGHLPEGVYFIHLTNSSGKLGVYSILRR